jgi:hypothetical protein
MPGMHRARRSYEKGADVTTQREDDFPRELSAPARRALAAAGYERLRQLSAVREADLRQLHGNGPKALGQLRRALGATGLSFADEQHANGGSPSA